MTKKQIRIDLIPEPIMTEIQRTAALPEEMKETKRPFYSELRQSLEELPDKDDMHVFLGGMLLGTLYQNPEDPFSRVYQTIVVPQDNVGREVEQRLSDIYASIC